MAWLDGWSYRIPVAIDNSGAAGTVDAAIAIPDDWDHFWDAIDTDGDEIRLTSADGTELLTYQWSSSPAFNKANRAGLIEIDAMTADGTNASMILIWLYYGNTGAASGAGSFTLATSAVDGFIYLGRPSGYLAQGRPPTPGTTQPETRLQKSSTEEVRVWLEVRRLMETRHRKAAGSLLWEEPHKIVSSIVNSSGTPQAAMIDQAATRFVEILSGPGRGLWVGLLWKAGTTATNYTFVPSVYTYAPEVTVNGTALEAGINRLLQPRIYLAVNDALAP